jgi:hypothetical protein
LFRTARGIGHRSFVTCGRFLTHVGGETWLIGAIELHGGLQGGTGGEGGRKAKFSNRFFQDTEKPVSRKNSCKAIAWFVLLKIKCTIFS